MLQVPIYGPDAVGPGHANGIGEIRNGNAFLASVFVKGHGHEGMAVMANMSINNGHHGHIFFGSDMAKLDT
ncbi:hypothetical protein [Gluconobacter oxydans]|uniref:hypothetical protein n=1 Tax=Gluconobacter oxydans TaxID=442 RepID=UPI000784F6A7|nr:hypothetical protein [Gluconobacter oxydans]KXV12583.1 hypothetical protein AD932_06640 [Gluconobacter oxydans]